MTKEKVISGFARGGASWYSGGGSLIDCLYDGGGSKGLFCLMVVIADVVRCGNVCAARFRTCHENKISPRSNERVIHSQLRV